MQEYIDLGRDTFIHRDLIGAITGDHTRVCHIHERLKDEEPRTFKAIDWEKIQGLCLMRDGEVLPVYAPMALIREQAGLPTTYEECEPPYPNMPVFPFQEARRVQESEGAATP